jgi:hypothetical protein
MSLVYGIVTGILFGFLLQKARVVRYDKQMGALRLRDMTIVKFMLSSVLVGMVLIYVFLDLGLVWLSVKSLVLGHVVLGGAIFGLGWGLLGYCPGTAAGAVGEGRLDAVWGILGMLVGARLFAEAYPITRSPMFTWADYGRLTLPELLGMGHWPLIAVVFLVVLAMLLLFEWAGL